MVGCNWGGGVGVVLLWGVLGVLWGGCVFFEFGEFVEEEGFVFGVESVLEFCGAVVDSLFHGVGDSLDSVHGFFCC